MLRITTEPDGTPTLTNANGAEVYAFITPLPQDASKVTYAKPSPIPNVYRMLATLEGGHFNPIEDKDLPDSFDMDAKPTSELFFPGTEVPGESMPLFFMALSNTIHKALNENHRVSLGTQYDMQLLEFDFLFAAAWICAFPTMVDMLGLPDHGHGHVASVVGGRTILIHAIRPDNTADDIMALAAATEQYYPMQVGKVSPQVYWVQGTKWRSLALKEGRGIFLPEDFPVKRNADGAPLMSDGRAGIRV